MSGLDAFLHYAIEGATQARQYGDLLAPQTVTLSDGTIGYYCAASRKDDCFQAAIATVLQVPKADVPDGRIDERLAEGATPAAVERRVWGELLAWLRVRQLEILLHRSVPAARARWIGVVPVPGPFQSHSLVMAHDELLFDPIPPKVNPIGRVVARFDGRHVRFGFSFRRRGRKETTYA